MDRNYHDRVLKRRQLVTQHPATVVGAIPSGAAAVDELYAYLMADYLPRRFPTIFTLDERDGQTIRNAVTGAAFPTRASSPEDALKALAETVDDDMFLLHQTPEGHRSVAYVCCYPSGFDPAEKLDKLLVEIHEPVPSYHKIGPSMERFFGRVEVGKNVKRVNVSGVDRFVDTEFWKKQGPAKKKKRGGGGGGGRPKEKKELRGKGAWHCSFQGC